MATAAARVLAGSPSGCRLPSLAPQGLIVLAAIRPGDEERLRNVLRPIGDDIKGRTLQNAPARPHIDFNRSRTIHFARFAILDDSGRGPGRKRLLYASTHDGDLDGHLADLTAITTDMDAVWGACEAYEDAARFGAFMRAHVQRSALVVRRRATEARTRMSRQARR